MGAAADDTETVSVPLAKAEAGLQLKPGHKTVIIIEDGHGTKPKPKPDDPGPSEPDQPDPPDKPDDPSDHKDDPPADPKKPDDPKPEPKKPDDPQPKPPSDGPKPSPQPDPKKPDPKPAPAPAPQPEPKQPDPPKPPDPPKATKSAQASFGAAHFETDKAFPLASALPTFKAVAALSNKEPKRILLVVGHTDAVGSTEHNVALSDERAQAIAAFLKDDVDAWMKFYAADGHDSKQWGATESLHMAKALGFASVADFQKKNSVKDDDATRKALIKQYMATEGTSVPKGVDVQTLGCGEYHLLQKTQKASQANRRVDVLAFEGPIQPPPDQCKNGQHPGCTVYDDWIKEVTGKIQ